LVIKKSIGCYEAPRDKPQRNSGGVARRKYAMIIGVYFDSIHYPLTTTIYNIGKEEAQG
jgi:hypothetical protein